MTVNSSRVIKGDRDAMRRANGNGESSLLYIICAYTYVCTSDGKQQTSESSQFKSTICGSISWHMMDELTKKNHFPLWTGHTIEATSSSSSRGCTPGVEGAPSSPAGEELLQTSPHSSRDQSQWCQVGTLCSACRPTL